MIVIKGLIYSLFSGKLTRLWQVLKQSTANMVAVYQVAGAGAFTRDVSEGVSERMIKMRNVAKLIASQARDEMARLLADAETSFAEVAQFAAEVNEAGSEVFCGDSKTGAIWFYVDRPDDERDQYKLSQNGILTRTRDGSRTSSQEHRFGEFACTPDEFANAFANRLEIALRDQGEHTTALKSLATRICKKPVIEVCQWCYSGRSVARLASTGFERDGECLVGAVNHLLMEMRAQGLPGTWDDYTIVIIKDYEKYSKLR